MSPGPRIPQRRVPVSRHRYRRGGSELLAPGDGGDGPRRNYFLRLNKRVSFLLSIITTRRANANDGDKGIGQYYKGQESTRNV